MKTKNYKIISKIAFWLMLLQVMMVIWVLILAVTWVVINKTKGDCPQKFETEKGKSIDEGDNHNQGDQPRNEQR